MQMYYWLTLYCYNFVNEQNDYGNSVITPNMHCHLKESILDFSPIHTSRCLYKLLVSDYGHPMMLYSHVHVFSFITHAQVAMICNMHELFHTHDCELNTVYLIGLGQVARAETMEREH